jgi:hypothetical protein
MVNRAASRAGYGASIGDTAMTDEQRTLIKRLDIHVTKADDAGMYTTGNVLFIAAREIERLAACVAAFEAQGEKRP